MSENKDKENSELHFFIIQEILKKGFAPDLRELSNLLNRSEDDTKSALYRLQDDHGVVLHPNEPKIWVMHPFALTPTNFLVRSEKGKWWGNCGWCSLGIAALLKENVTITTNVGAEDKQIIIEIIDGEVIQKDLMIHFPVPMKDAWKNVIYTCSIMLVFENQYQVRNWSSGHNIPVGDIQPIDKIWNFSKKWYGSHANCDWKKWTIDEAKAMFKEFGLNHSVWELEDSRKNF